MRLPVPATYLWLFPVTLGVGWCATRIASFIHHTKGSRTDRLTMLIVGWAPLASWLAALLVTLSERHP